MQQGNLTRHNISLVINMGLLLLNSFIRNETFLLRGHIQQYSGITLSSALNTVQSSGMQSMCYSPLVYLPGPEYGTFFAWICWPKLWSCPLFLLSGPHTYPPLCLLREERGQQGFCLGTEPVNSLSQSDFVDKLLLRKCVCTGLCHHLWDWGWTSAHFSKRTDLIDRNYICESNISFNGTKTTTQGTKTCSAEWLFLHHKEIHHGFEKYKRIRKFLLLLQVFKARTILVFH